jgi:hypothetical protein
MNPIPLERIKETVDLFSKYPFQNPIAPMVTQLVGFFGLNQGDGEM